jgi:hypothetical protein
MITINMDQMRWRDSWDGFFNNSTAETRGGYYYVDKRDDQYHASFNLVNWVSDDGMSHCAHVGYVNLGMNDSLSDAKAACEYHASRTGR